MIFSNIVAYKLDKGELPTSADALTELLAPFSFTPLTDLEEKRVGFCPPTDASEELAISAGEGTLVFALRTDKKSIPASSIKMRLKEQQKVTEQAQGYKVGRKQLKEMREDIITALLPHVIATTSITHVILHGDEMYIGTSGFPASDEVVTHVLRALQGVGFEFPFPLHIRSSMTQWLLNDHVDGGNLRVSDLAQLEGGGASIQWKNHDADENDVQKYIKQGKQVVKMRLELEVEGSELEPIYFMLNEKGIIQQVKLEKGESSEEVKDDSDPMSLFISNVAITAQVASVLVASVKEALEIEE